MKRKYIYLLFFSSLFSLTMAGCCDNAPQDYTISDWRIVEDFRVQKVFNSIDEGDLIVSNQYSVGYFDLYESSMGSSKAELVPIQEGYSQITSERMLIGVKIKDNSDMRPGAILKVVDGRKQVGSVLVIDRDQNLATAWVIENSREFQEKDYIQ